MDTQHGADVQDHEQSLSGELHLPQEANALSQRINDSVQPSIPDAPPQLDSQKPDDDDSNQHIFYFEEDEPLNEDESDSDAFGSVISTPFQMSEAMPPVQTGRGQVVQQVPTPQPSTGGTRSPRRFPVVRVLILAAVIVLIIATGAMAFAQSSPAALPVVHTTTTGYNSGNGLQAASTQKPHMVQSTVPTPKPTSPQALGQGTTVGQHGAPGTWLPQQLPAGWTDAGLTIGDALFSERTAAAFTDREMSLDYRSVGTRAHHGGTFTAATFVLTANAKARFAQNDVRMTNNVLFDRVQQGKLIQSVVNAQPQLVQFATNGQQNMAWVDVSFQLWQSKIDAASTRTEGFDLDPATGQPRTHHMMVLLLQVPQNTQGANPAMGGTGWLVSTYAFDLPSNTSLALVQPA